jgi:4-hydroxy-tetrahydrodipicolinate reductase
MPNLAIVGHGKMGRLIEQLAPQYGFTVRATLNTSNNAGGIGLTREAFEGIDVAIEFSNPTAAITNLPRLAGLGIPTVTGTTGWFHELPTAQAAFEARGSALVWSANFSIGLYRFRQIVAAAARAFAAENDYEAWGWEIHHSAKRDAPSGTLLALAEQMKVSGYSRPVNLSSSRAGAHPGTHEIGFDSAADSITIRHTARSREGFARGALRAAHWIIGKRGVFEFKDIVDQLDSIQPQRRAFSAGAGSAPTPSSAPDCHSACPEPRRERSEESALKHGLNAN